MLDVYQLELRHYRYFMAVAETLHFRKAAEKLYISQPGLTRQIKQMEEILGVDLFIRNQRNVALTTAGMYLKQEIAFVLNHLEATQKQLQQVHKGVEGEIKIGYLGSAMQYVIPNLLVQLKKQFPGIKAVLQEMSNYNQVEAVQNDAIDIGFVRLATVSAPLLMYPVFSETFSLVLPMNHSISEDNFTSINQVADEQFILFSVEYSSMYYHTIMSIFTDAGFNPKLSHQSVHALTIFKLVECGLGLAIVPTSLCASYNLQIKGIELTNIPQRAVLSVIWNNKNRNPVLPSVTNLVQKI